MEYQYPVFDHFSRSVEAHPAVEGTSREVPVSHLTPGIKCISFEWTAWYERG